MSEEQRQNPRWVAELAQIPCGTKQRLERQHHISRPIGYRSDYRWLDWFAVKKEFTLEKDDPAKREEMARKAGIAVVAPDVLHNIGNVLNSINISASTSEEGFSENPEFD
ncbi:MAG: hypothetical protein AAF483_18235 [Planctomycetota bacterium]